MIGLRFGGVAEQMLSQQILSSLVSSFHFSSFHLTQGDSIKKQTWLFFPALSQASRKARDILKNLFVN